MREQLAYRITDVSTVPTGTPDTFAFEDRQSSRERALFVQDQIRSDHLTLRAGVRWDTYRLVVAEHALSPRVSAAWSWPQRGVVLRAAYDRAFQTPAFENLLLASSAQVSVLSDSVLRIPVRPSRGHFLESGLAMTIRGQWRIEGTVFNRRMDHFADDDVLLNTGISIPITFRQARVRGLELTLDAPRWRRLSTNVGYTLMSGTGEGPVTGGLFLDQRDLSELADGRFPLTQDQRHTLRARTHATFGRKAWAGGSFSLNSGLPVEWDAEPDTAVARYGERIVRRVNLATGRVRPSWTLDVSAGITLRATDLSRVSLQGDVRNVTNQLNVINFAGLFSGTGLAPPRTLGAQLRVEF